MEILTDNEIRDLLEMEKISLRKIDTNNLRLGPLGQKRATFDVQGIDGSRFKVKIRQSSKNLFDFSVILSYYIPETNRFYNLRRYNGSSHRHTNKIEGNVIEYKFHTHVATERYLRRGFRIEGYATETDRYHTIEECLIVFLKDCKIIQGSSFPTRLVEFGQNGR